MAYAPEYGDVIWVDLDPRVGREQSGHRPALVLTPDRYNRRTSMAVCCPITSRRKRNNLEIVLPQGLKVKGVVLTHQVRSIDWSERGAEFMTRLPDHVVDDVIDMIASILDLP